MAPKRTSQTAAETVSDVVDGSVVETVTTDGVSSEVVSEVVQSEVVVVDKFVVVLERLQRFATELKDTIVVVKALQKEFQKVQKTSAKKTKKVSPNTPAKPRTPSGFAKPTKLSDDLCTFLGVPSASQMARTEVTRVINEYIKKNSLQDTNDKRTIVPDEKLLSILKLGEGEKLTYFNLQTYIKHHFQKD
jgi:chromatin remodeling complex protein RSC6